MGHLPKRPEQNLQSQKPHLHGGFELVSWEGVVLGGIALPLPCYLVEFHTQQINKKSRTCSFKIQNLQQIDYFHTER